MSPKKDIFASAKSLIDLCNQKKITLTMAESCTGGLVAAAVTDVPGASQCLMGSFVTYSDFMKMKLLGVSTQTLEDFGAVSEQTAREMVTGALKAVSADIGIAVTGIAGPSGGSEEKPVGLVHFASASRIAQNIHTHHEKHQFKSGSRQSIRQDAVCVALNMLLLEARNY